MLLKDVISARRIDVSNMTSPLLSQFYSTVVRPSTWHIRGQCQNGSRYEHVVLPVGIKDYSVFMPKIVFGVHPEREHQNGEPSGRKKEFRPIRHHSSETMGDMISSTP